LNSIVGWDFNAARVYPGYIEILKWPGYDWSASEFFFIFHSAPIYQVKKRIKGFKNGIGAAEI
jgi:hypothetical protein